MRFKKIYIEITNICNRDCSFCIKSKRAKREMNLLEFKRVINQIKPYTKYVYLHVKGEPFLHSNFEKIINICDEEKIKVNITTNGTLIEKYIEFIKNSKAIRQINISLHSFKEEEEIKKLFHLVDELNETTNIYLVYRYWTLNKLNNSKFNVCIDKLISHYNFDSVMIDKINKEQNIKINKTLYINKDYEFVWPSLNNKIYNEFGNCLGLKTHIAILSDGTVIPCCLDGEGVINLGNIFKDDLKNILESERVEKIIKGFNNNKKIEELCRHCCFKNK